MKDQIIKYSPNQSGFFKKRFEFSSPYSINLNGWNSSISRYQKQTNNIYRVAVIGDSFVEGFHVPLNNHFAELLMKDTSLEIEVYRFGVSAAPLSQYLFMLKKEVLSYSPDLIIYLFIHNDFEQSYTFPPGRITSSFMKFKFDDQNQISEIPPNTFKPSYRLLKKSRVFCFLWYQFQFDRIPYLKSIQTVFLQPEKETFFAKKPHSINNKNKLITEYFFDENIRLQKKHSFEFLVAMDAQRNSTQHSIYNKDSNIPDPLNLMVANVAAMKKILFIDLTKPFQTDYHLHGKKFEYRCDNHWNSYGHRVVYETLAPIVTRFKNKHLEK